MSQDIGRSIGRGHERERGPSTRQLQDITERLRQVPSVWPSMPVPQQLFLIFANGQTVAGIAGIKYLSAPPASAPIYNADNDTSFADGLGSAELWDAAAGRLGKVLVCNYNPLHPMFCPLGARFRTFRTVSIPLDTDATKSQMFYLPWGY